jgi:hypothetical protein
MLEQSDSDDNGDYQMGQTQHISTPEFPTDIATEVWKIVPGFGRELYASSFGRVMQFVQRGRKWYPPTFGTTIRHGYPTLVHRQRVRRVHFLVATAFHGLKPSSEYTVDHIAKHGGDWAKERSDNRAINLRWATKQAQCQNRKRAAPRVDTHQQGPALWSTDEEFRDTIACIKVSQYGRAMNTTRVPYTAMASAGQDYAMVGHPKFMFHRLVALAFPDICGQAPKDSNATVDHIDRDRANNHANNLRWATKSEQARNQTRKDSTEILSKLKISVECRSPNASNWTVYQSLSAASKATGVDHNTIRHAIKQNPDGYTIRIRKNAGWCFRVKKDRSPEEANSMPSPRMIVDCRAPESEYWTSYESFNAASRATGIHCNTIRAAAALNLNGHTITMKCKATGWSFRMH